MEIVYDESMLKKYVEGAIEITPEKPMLLDKFLEDALECEVDAISDGKEVFIRQSWNTSSLQASTLGTAHAFCRRSDKR